MAAMQAPALNSKFLIDDISLKVSRAMSLDSTNNSLGRAFIRDALTADDAASFVTTAKGYGEGIDDDFAQQLYDGIHRFNERLVRQPARLSHPAAALQSQRQTNMASSEWRR